MPSLGMKNNLISCENTHYIIYSLIINKLATYKELRDDYTIEEALDLYEMLMVSNYNKQLIQDEVIENNGRYKQLH